MTRFTPPHVTLVLAASEVDRIVFALGVASGVLPPTEEERRLLCRMRAVQADIVRQVKDVAAEPLPS